MRRSTTVSALTATLIALLLTADATAQRRLRTRRQPRPKEVKERVAVYFTDTNGPAVEGDKVAELATIALVREAIAAKQPSVLYLVDRSGDAIERGGFEWRLFRSDELGILLRGFHCGRIDLAKSAPLAARYGRRAPLFVVFDAKGKATEVAMTGYKPSQTSLKGALIRAGNRGKPPLSRFTERYRDFLSDFERLLVKIDQAEKARAGADGAARRHEIDRQLAALRAKKDELLDRERKLIEEARLPERPKGATRLGRRRPRGDRRGR